MQLKKEDMESLSQHVESILINEVNNWNAVYLYLENGYWYAYERSAYYLSRLNTPVRIDREVIGGGYDVILLRAALAMDDLCLPIAQHTVLRLVSDDKLLFLVEESFEGFPEWKNHLLAQLPA